MKQRSSSEVVQIMAMAQLTFGYQDLAAGLRFFISSSFIQKSDTDEPTIRWSMDEQ
jgi:hypothetical protein